MFIGLIKSKMILLNLLLLFLVNIKIAYGCTDLCDLKSAIKCGETETDSSSARLFVISPLENLKYTRSSKFKNPTIIQMKENIGSIDLAYHARRKRLYWTSPPNGFWTTNARIYSLPWDYRFACENYDNLPWNIAAKKEEQVEVKEEDEDEEDVKKEDLEKIEVEQDAQKMKREVQKEENKVKEKEEQEEESKEEATTQNEEVEFELKTQEANEGSNEEEDGDAKKDDKIVSDVKTNEKEDETTEKDDTAVSDPSENEEEDEDDEEDDDDEEKDNNKCCIETKKMYDRHRQEDIEILYEKENWNPRSLAVDYVGDKLYVVDTAARSVNIFDLDGKNEATVFQNDTLIPMEVVLDPPEGFMFVLAANIKTGMMEIYRANMDGTSLTLLVNDADKLGRFFVEPKVGFTIDTLKKRLYFRNFEKEMIECVDYKGNERLYVVDAVYSVSISIQNRTLYWSDGRHVTAGLPLCIDKECNVHSCILNEKGECNQESILKVMKVRQLSTKSYVIKVVDPSAQRQIPNPCGINNGGCQHHCLLKSAGAEGQDLDFGCACRDGYRLASDNKSCTPAKVTYTYDAASVGNNIYFSDLWNKTDTEDVLPISRKLLYHLYLDQPDTIFYQTPFRYIQVTKSGEQLVDQYLAPIDKMSSNILQNHILARNEYSLKSDHFRKTLDDKTSVLRNYVDESIVKAIAYDWITKNIYFVKSSSDADELGELFVLRYDKPDRTVSTELNRENFTSASDASLTKIQRPVSMVVHPYRGYVFVALQNGSLIRLNSDGSGQLIFPNVNDSVLLAVDLNDDKLYWLDSEGYVSYGNLDGSDPKQLLKTYSESTELIYVHGKWLYARSDESKRIWRFDKLTGADASFLKKSEALFQHKSLGLRVSARDAQLGDIDHPCADDNGGCEMFCFAVPETGSQLLKKVCGCGKGQRILENGLNCSPVMDRLMKK